MIGSRCRSGNLVEICERHPRLNSLNGFTRLDKAATRLTEENMLDVSLRSSQQMKVRFPLNCPSYQFTCLVVPSLSPTKPQKMVREIGRSHPTQPERLRWKSRQLVCAPLSPLPACGRDWCAHNRFLASLGPRSLVLILRHKEVTCLSSRHTGGGIKLEAPRRPGGKLI